MGAASGHEVTYQHRTVATTTAGLLDLAEWLGAAGCTHAAMEATGVYWKLVWHVLDGHFTLVLANAMHSQTLGAMPIAAAVMREGLVCALVTAIPVPAERRRAALGDGPEDAPMLAGDPRAVRLQELIAMLAHDVEYRTITGDVGPNKLSRTFEFQDFVQSLGFVNSLLAYFETLMIIATCGSRTGR